jgi:CRISPR/Cas system-associated protein Cas10 (large subunit of type III CRISPR-Cas system)
MIEIEQKRSFLTGPKTAYFNSIRAKRTLFNDVKEAYLQSKANLLDVFIYESKASKAAFFDIEFYYRKYFEIIKSAFF